MAVEKILLLLVLSTAGLCREIGFKGKFVPLLFNYNCIKTTDVLKKIADEAAEIQG